MKKGVVGSVNPMAKYGKEAVREAAGQSLQNQVSAKRQAATTVPKRTKNFKGERAFRYRTLRQERRSLTVPNGQNHPHHPRPKKIPYAASTPRR
jgi:hypothetical protein